MIESPVSSGKREQRMSHSSRFQDGGGKKRNGEGGKRRGKRARERARRKKEERMRVEWSRFSFLLSVQQTVSMLSESPVYGRGNQMEWDSASREEKRRTVERRDRGAKKREEKGQKEKKSPSVAPEGDEQLATGR